MADRRRILLAEVTPLVPQAPVPATWNPLDKEADAGLDSGDLRVFKNTSDPSAWSCVRANTTFAAGQWYWETTVVFTGATSDFGVGVLWRSTLGTWLNLDPGAAVAFQPLGIAVNRAGEIRWGGTVVGSVGAVASGAVIRHWIDFDARIYRVALNGGAWVAVSTGNWFTWPGVDRAPVAGCKRPFGTTVFVTANFGATPFAYPKPDGANAGVYSTPDPAPTTFYLGSEGFNTESKDTPASTHYEGRIAGDQDLEVEREGGCDVWGNQSISRPGQLVLINADGGLSAWRDYIWRDAPISFYSGYEGDERSDFTLWSEGRVDGIDFTRSLRVALVLVDQLALLDRAIQDALYPDDSANTSIIGRPLPIVLGRPLYCDPVRLNSSPIARQYQVHDGLAVAGYTTGLDSIAQVYDKGDVFLGPDDAYTAHNPITTATTGAAGGGAFTNWALDGGGVSMPFNWVRITAFGASNDRFTNNGSALRCQSSGQQITAIFHSNPVQSGYRYTVAFSVTSLTTQGTLTFRVGLSGGGMVDYPYTITSTGAKSVTIDVPDNANLQIVLGASQLDATIDNVTVSSVQIIDWTYWPDTSTKKGATLANTPAGKIAMNPVGPRRVFGSIVVEHLGTALAYLIARAKLQNAAIANAPSATALTNGADYRVATYLAAPKTYLALIRELLNGWCGWLTVTRAGAFAVGQVAEPSQSAVLTLDDLNIVGEIETTPDLAKGLSLRVAGARNHSPHTDSDIAEAVDPVLRDALKAEFTVVRTGAPTLTVGAVSPAYTQALDAAATPTLLQDAADIQAAANKRATLWRPARRFYAVSALLTAAAADALEPGQTVRLVWPKFGLSAGKNLLVVGVRSRFFSRRVDLKLWG